MLNQNKFLMKIFSKKISLEDARVSYGDTDAHPKSF